MQTKNWKIQTHKSKNANEQIQKYKLNGVQIFCLLLQYSISNENSKYENANKKYKHTNTKIQSHKNKNINTQIQKYKLNGLKYSVCFCNIPCQLESCACYRKRHCATKTNKRNAMNLSKLTQAQM